MESSNDQFYNHVQTKDYWFKKDKDFKDKEAVEISKDKYQNIMKQAE